MPIRWEELDDPELRSDRWTIRDAGSRVMEVGDVFAEVLTRRQPLRPVGESVIHGEDVSEG
jgi:bifunctional non-homologous end joining protein LigD